MMVQSSESFLCHMNQILLLFQYLKYSCWNRNNVWLSCWRRTKNFNYGNTPFLYPFKHSLMIKMDVTCKYGSTFCFILVSDKGYVNFSNPSFECILCGLMIELVGSYHHHHHSLQLENELIICKRLIILGFKSASFFL